MMPPSRHGRRLSTSHTLTRVALPAFSEPLEIMLQDIMTGTGDIGDNMDAWACNGGTNQNFWYDYDAGEIGNEAFSVCMGVC